MMNKIINKKAIVAAILVVTMFLSALSYGASFAYGATQDPGATLKLDPSSGTHSSGTFNVAIKVDTGGEAINALKAYFTFPADKLSVVSIDTTGSFLTFWAENTHDNTSGTIHLQGALPTPGYTGTDGLVATVTFQVVSSGIANVLFDSSSKVLRNSDNTNIFSNRVNGTYTLGGGPTYILATNVYPVGSGSVTLNPAGGTYDYNTVVTLTATPDTGWHFVIWSGVATGTALTTTVIMDGNKTITATFAIDTYTITVSAGLNGSISPTGTILVNSGDSKTFTITPDLGYHIKDVKVDGSSVGTVSSYTFANVTASHTISATFEKQILQKVIILQIGKTSFTVNGIPNTLDSPPIIKNNRTLLPIRAIIEALGGTVSWDPNEKKVTVILGSTTLELWIGKSIAKVNGVDTPIDPANSKVVPEIINSRTMLPLRFVAESLGCDVQWDGTTKTITITYQQ